MKPTQSKKQYTLTELTHGLDVTIQGDPDCVIAGVCAIDRAKPGCITFLMNSLYKKYLTTTHAAAVIVSPDMAEMCSGNAIVSRDPYFTYSQIAKYFDDKPSSGAGCHPTAVIGKDCHIDPSASIGPHCVIGDHVSIGAGVILGAGCVIGEYSQIDEDVCFGANVTLYHKVMVGKRVVIASGTVIGSDGFGIAKHKGTWHKVPQLGRVIIEDDVEIGANCAIDRGAIEDTVIGKGTKLDNLIQIGHNVRIGSNTAIAGCVGISGSTVIGNNCLIGGLSGFAGHIQIANDVAITAMTAVSKSVTQPGVYSSGVGGLMTNLEWRKNSARLRRLEQLMERVKTLELALEEIIERNST